MTSGGPSSATLSKAAVETSAAEQAESRTDEQTATRPRRPARKTRASSRRTRIEGFFAQPAHDYAYHAPGRPVTVLQAGCLTSLDELGLDKLRSDGFSISVVSVEADPGRLRDLAADIIIGDLRTIPLPPRSFDIVHCSLLLDRISHVPLVLDRLAAALRPGGLLLLRIRDRDCAAGFLDRSCPAWSGARSGGGCIRGSPARSRLCTRPPPRPAASPRTCSCAAWSSRSARRPGPCRTSRNDCAASSRRHAGSSPASAAGS